MKNRFQELAEKLVDDLGSPYPIAHAKQVRETLKGVAVEFAQFCQMKTAKEFYGTDAGELFAMFVRQAK